MGIILQARMGSTRLPGKVLRLLGGRPMIDRIVGRLRNIDEDVPVILATSAEKQDDELARHCTDLGTPVFRGSETDVLDRYYRCALEHGLDHVVRATGDNPFVDLGEARRLIKQYGKDKPDYMESVTGGLPSGCGLEIFSIAALELSCEQGSAPHHREHVNEFILENPDRFRCMILSAPPEKTAPHMSFTVDTPDDIAKADELLAASQSESGNDEPETGWLIKMQAQEARKT